MTRASRGLEVSYSNAHSYFVQWNDEGSEGPHASDNKPHFPHCQHFIRCEKSNGNGIDIFRWIVAGLEEYRK